jgi:serine/threonine protein kinase
MADDTGLTREPVADTTGVTKQERPSRAAAAAGSPAQPAFSPTRGALAPGTKVGRYEVIRLVGEGGMGTVYEALDARLNRRVALKVLSPAVKSKRKAAKRFAIEAQAAARLVHPNVVRIYDFDMECASPYMAMEFLEGETLACEIARGPLAFDRMADIMLAVCAGVEAAHQAGIVHRDLKPSNIFLCSDWQGHKSARVLDFGISKVGGVSGSGLTETGDIVGTSQYLSPEQAAGLRHVSEASDQYSLGVVMYECATQRTPQQGLPIHTLLRNVTKGSHVPPRELRADLPAAIEAVIERAMSVRPKDRFRSVHELGRAIFPFASAEGQRQLDDYYRSDPEEGWPERANARRQSAGFGAGPSAPPTLRQPDEPPPAWQARTTRTSARGHHSGSGPADGRAAPAVRSRGVLYSVAIGAVLAAATLAILLLLLRP